jgi:hypothetical protein
LQKTAQENPALTFEKASASKPFFSPQRKTAKNTAVFSKNSHSQILHPLHAQI